MIAPTSILRPFAAPRGRTLFVAAALVAPAVLLVGLATEAWGLLLAVAAAGFALAWSVIDVRAAFLVLLFLGTFVDYNTGILTLEMAILCAWVLWTGLLLYWRSAWRGWTTPPREMIVGLAAWTSALALGVAVGVLRENRWRNLGLELEAALWPFYGIAMMQAFRRKDARFAAIGLVVVGLIHTGFGLTMLQIIQRRVGGIYFTTVTGIVAVMLWTAALLAPARRTRIICLVAMVPMLAHLLFSFTRGYWLGALAGLAVAALLAWRNLRRFALETRVLRRLGALAAVLAVTLFLSLVYFGSGKLLDAVGGRFGSSFSTEVSGETMSNVIRLAEYDAAIGAALRSPWIGNGLGYAIVAREPLTGVAKEQWFVHNYYLLLWLKLGVLGLLAFGFLLWRWVRAAMRVADLDPSWTARAVAITAVAVTVQVLVILLTNYSLADVTTASTFAFVWGLFWTMRAHPFEPALPDASARS